MSAPFVKLFLFIVSIVTFLTGAIPAGFADQTSSGSEPQRALLDFNPRAITETAPENFIRSTAVQVDGQELPSGQPYEAAETIDFSYGENYTDVDGIVTFRGNNFRNSGSFGYANMEKYRFADAWNIATGTTSYNGETWTGSGWVGQPLMVHWPSSTKAAMANMEDWAKKDDDLVEVIYATMDGNVYFLDLKSGKQTREPIRLGFTFKGAGALDPRGYPILYLGSGYNSVKGTSRVFIINLLDGSVMHTFGDNDSFSLRGSLSFFDSSALVDAETDQLIYPGENGILYIIKLNTQYDESGGTLSIDPSPAVKWHYSGVRTGSAYWVGMEDSAVIWRGHIIMSDNGGNLMCLNLNTLELDWVQDTLDDTNCSPVLSIEDDHPYIYISTSFHYGWRSTSTATIPLWKINAENGDIVWQKDYSCYTMKGVSGGVQSTAAIGKHDLSGKVYFTVAKTDAAGHGRLVCLDTATGDVLWEHESDYTWSSPVLVYSEGGSGSVIYANSTGTMFMLDGETGKEQDTFDLGGNVEASPAVYKDWLVTGTRTCQIWGVHLT